jgi:hypothetical protein
VWPLTGPLFLTVTWNRDPGDQTADGLITLASDIIPSLKPIHFRHTPAISISRWWESKSVFSPISVWSEFAPPSRGNNRPGLKQGHEPTRLNGSPLCRDRFKWRARRPNASPLWRLAGNPSATRSAPVQAKVTHSDVMHHRFNGRAFAEAASKTPGMCAPLAAERRTMSSWCS